jgi:CheY-like chemotaxis protein
MSHEIRTPLSAVVGYTEMLMDTSLNEEQMDFVKYVREGGKTILALLDDMLDISRIEAGLLTFDPIDFDPEIMAYDVCELIAPRVGDKPVDILCRIGNRVPAYIKTDAGRFRQVLLNLVGNALKFTEKGKVELCLEVDEEEENRLKMHACIRDTGIGIPKEKLESIFEMFRQGDENTSRMYGGSGLGLPICKQISNLMGGDVWVESRPGEGSVFHFTAWVEKSKKSSFLRAVPAGISGKRVLVVDDNMDSLEILILRLESAGMRCEGIYSGEQVTPTLQKAFDEGDPFDLCLLDIQLPGLSGYDVLKRIRSLAPPLSRIPVLGFSSAGFNRAKKYRDAGFDGFLPRPIHRQKLLEMAARLMGNTKITTTEEPGTSEKDRLLTRYTLVEEAKAAVRILVVEDNLINQKLIRSILTRSGYQVDIVNNGKEAVDTFTANPHAYDLIFMDIQMPVMDGLDATRIIREKGYEDIPIIAVTAGVMKGEREKYLDAGLNDFIPKPIKRDMVFAMVKKWALEKKGVEE